MTGERGAGAASSACLLDSQAHHRQVWQPARGTVKMTEGDKTSMTTKKRAIRNMIFRLGLHVRPEVVVRVLAEQGVQVSIYLVRQVRSEEHTSELQSLRHLVCRL